MKVLFMGAQGSGKSTQAQMLADEKGYFWLSTGEMLRSSTEPWIKEKLATGELFPDEFVTEMALGEIKKHEDVILDGFPRTKRQAEMIAENGVEISKIVEIEVSLEEMKARMLARGRADDTEEAIAKRLELFYANRDEIVETLKKHNPEMKIVKVDGEGTMEEVRERVAKEF